MKQQILIPVGVILFTAAITGGIWSSQGSVDQRSATDKTNSLITLNSNIGIPQTYGPAIVFTGKVIPFSSAFQQPDTTGWKSFKLRDIEIPFHQKFTQCYSELLGPTWYLTVPSCVGNQDGPFISISDITDKVRRGDASLLYTYAKDVQIAITHQFRSDEIRDTINGHTVWCYDDVQVRYCEIRRDENTIFFVIGNFYHLGDRAERDTFKSIILSLTQ